MKIFLLGFMGSGKSTLGKCLAKRLGWSFYDLDDLIEKRAGMTVSEIFSQKGEDAFRRIEAKQLRSTIDLSKAIIATGGGTPCFFGNLDWMKDMGFLIYLEASIDTLLARLKMDAGARPLLKEKTDLELKTFIERLLSQREAYYQQANYKCLADREIDLLCQKLFEYFSKFRN